MTIRYTTSYSERLATSGQALRQYCHLINPLWSPSLSVAPLKPQRRCRDGHPAVSIVGTRTIATCTPDVLARIVHFKALPNKTRSLRRVIVITLLPLTLTLQQVTQKPKRRVIIEVVISNSSVGSYVCKAWFIKNMFSDPNEEELRRLTVSII